eukprot:s48_g16.t1
MGFDCIWVTPVVLNLYGPDGQSGYGYHGYWAQDWFRIDPNFGTAEDMKLLVQKTHEKGMCFILDIVLNHVRPIHSLKELAEVNPFNETKYFHLRNISNMTFDEYAKKMSGWPYPSQGIGAGAQCYLQFFPNGEPDGTNNGNNYPGNNYSEEYYFGERAHGPAYLKYCSVGNYECSGYNELMSEQGWFYDLADLNQSVPFVREQLKKYVMWLVHDFDVDGFRLDTTPYMPHWWLKEVQDMLSALENPLHILGEVTASNISFHASYQLQDGEPVLGGMENFPLVYAAVPGLAMPGHPFLELNTLVQWGYDRYCGWPNQLLSPVAQYDLTYLSNFSHVQLFSGLYSNPDLLMNMMDACRRNLYSTCVPRDNQDDPPIASITHSLDGESGGCKDDVHRLLNAWVWLFFAKGMPVLTWGDEQGNTIFRNSLWQFNWDQGTWQYHLIKKMNRIRNERKLHKKKMHIPELLCKAGIRDGHQSRISSSSMLLLNRLSLNGLTEEEDCGKAGHSDGESKPGTRMDSVWVFTNNLPNYTREVTYNVHLPKAPLGYRWKNIFDDQQTFGTETGKTGPNCGCLDYAPETSRNWGGKHGMQANDSGARTGSRAQLVIASCSCGTE